MVIKQVEGFSADNLIKHTGLYLQNMGCQVKVSDIGTNFISEKVENV